MTRIVIVAVLASACIEEQPVVVSETAQAAGSVCAAGPTTFGIDVSRFQGDINWPMVAGAGVKFAWIQISRSLTDIDVKFPYNWQHAKAAGILRGAYQRFHPGMDVMAQAKLFVDKLGPPEVGDLPPMLDVEDADGLGATQIAAAVKQWMDYVEPRVGVKPLIYTGFYFWRDSVGSADFSNHPLWIANYSATCPLVPDHWATWTIHQYSSTVTMAGIAANTVDVNKFNGTLADLQAMTIQPVEPPCSGDECPPCQVIDDANNIVDDGGPCFDAGGDPQYMREANAGYGSSLKWTLTTDAAAPVSSGTWNLNFANAGTYRVEAATPAPYNGSKQAVYQVHAGGTETVVTIDQSAVDGWTVLGDFDFAAGGNGQYIRVDDNTGEPSSTQTKLVFDALRFTPVEPPPPDDNDDEPGDKAGGCSTTGASSLWLIVAAFLLRRRRAENYQLGADSRARSLHRGHRRCDCASSRSFKRRPSATARSWRRMRSDSSTSAALTTTESISFARTASSRRSSRRVS